LDPLTPAKLTLLLSWVVRAKLTLALRTPEARPCPPTTSETKPAAQAQVEVPQLWVAKAAFPQGMAETQEAQAAVQEAQEVA